MKKVYAYSQEDLDNVIEWLEGAKKILDHEDSPHKLAGCRAAIDHALTYLLREED